MKGAVAVGPGQEGLEAAAGVIQPKWITVQPRHSTPPPNAVQEQPQQEPQEQEQGAQAPPNFGEAANAIQQFMQAVLNWQPIPLLKNTLLLCHLICSRVEAIVGH